MTDTEDRFTPRQMFAAIALATHLPMPSAVRYHGGIFALDFDTVSDGQAWADHLGAPGNPYVYRDGRHYLGARGVTWHGWLVSLSASEPATPDGGLDADTTAKLAEITDDTTTERA